MKQKKNPAIEIKKEYLKQYEKAIRQMKRSEIRMSELRMNKMYPALMLDGLPRGSAKPDMSSYAAKLDEENRKYLKARYQRIKLCTEIMDRIEAMENEDEKDVLIYRYIKLMRWEDISEKMSISERGVYRLHGRALLHFRIEKERT